MASVVRKKPGSWFLGRFDDCMCILEVVYGLELSMGARFPVIFPSRFRSTEDSSAPKPKTRKIYHGMSTFETNVVAFQHEEREHRRELEKPITGLRNLGLACFIHPAWQGVFRSLMLLRQSSVANKTGRYYQVGEFLPELFLILCTIMMVAIIPPPSPGTTKIGRASRL